MRLPTASAAGIGVVKDYNTSSLHDAVKPVLMVRFHSFIMMQE